MKKYVFKTIMQLAWQEMEKKDYGYEMGCLISAEFTPAPNYKDILPIIEKLCVKYGYTLLDFSDWLMDMDLAWKNPYCSSPYSAFMYILK